MSRRENASTLDWHTAPTVHCVPVHSGDTSLPALQLLAGERPLVIGHRGYCAVAPENTLPSFERALAAGPDLVEMDYHHSQDGLPVVIHDETLDRTTDARKRWGQKRIRVADKSAAEIQTLDAGGWFDAGFAGAKVPLLTEALHFIQKRGGVALVERKSGDAATCVGLLRERRLTNRLVVISFDWQYLRQFHEWEPGQLLGALGPPERLMDGRKPPRFSQALDGRWLDELVDTGAALVVWNRKVSRPAIQLAHERGLRVWVYTVNNPAPARRLLEIGVDGIITNKIPVIRKAVAAKASR